MSTRMPLSRIEETDEDFDSVPHPVNHDALTSSESFPPCPVSLHGDGQIGDGSVVSTVQRLDIPLG
jgi:hypothetical protein